MEIEREQKRNACIQRGRTTKGGKGGGGGGEREERGGGGGGGGGGGIGRREGGRGGGEEDKTHPSCVNGFEGSLIIVVYTAQRVCLKNQKKKKRISVYIDM